MAALSDDPWMLNALREGAGDFFDNYMMPICFPNVDVHNIDKTAKKEFRVKVKTVQYGLAFGREAKAIAVELGITVREAQAIIDNYLTTAEKFAEWRVNVKRAATDETLRDQYLLTPFGRRFQSEIITHKNKGNIEREALSFMPQAISSDICLVTAIRVHPWIKEQGAHIVALVHDAILVEIPGADPAAWTLADIIGKRIQSEFRLTGEAVFGDKVPYLSEFSYGRSWGDLL